jgi:hypothetical protein
MTAIPPPVAQAAAGSTASVATCLAEPLSHRVENMTTCRLDRVHGALADGAEFSVVAKTLHPASASPAFAVIPPEHHAQVLEDLHWLDEPDVYESGLAGLLPAPMRMPLVHQIERHVDERLTIWMEDVNDVEPWTLDRYHRTASALGALAGRWSESDAAAAFRLRRRDIGRLFFGKVLNHDVPIHDGDVIGQPVHCDCKSPQTGLCADPAAGTEHRKQEEMQHVGALAFVTREF